MSTAQHPALFSLIGTIYGGDGRDTFALPDLRGRTPIGAGQGPGLPTYKLGERGVTGLKLDHPTDTPTVGLRGKKMDNESLDRANDAKVTPYLALNWCIAVEGVYPSAS